MGSHSVEIILRCWVGREQLCRGEKSIERLKDLCEKVKLASGVTACPYVISVVIVNVQAK